MTDERLLELLLRWEEDDLPPDQERELRDRLELDPQARRELVDQFMLGAESWRLFRAGAAVTGGEGAAKGTASFQRKRKSGPAKVVSSRRRFRPLSPRRGPWLTSGLAAAAALLAGIFIFYLQPAKPPAIAALADAGPGTSVERDGRSLVAGNGFALVSGDTVRTAEGGMAQISYRDEATTLTLRGGTSLSIVSTPKGKRLILQAGELQADVAKQPVGQELVLATPQARAVVVGTRFRLAADQERTRLEVTAGKVRLIRESDQRLVEVAGGFFAIAAVDTELVARPLSGASATTGPVQPPPPPSKSLLAPWRHQDIGQVGLAGDATFADGVFTVKGGGEDIWQGADAFHFVYQPLPGDGTITARVTAIQYTDVWAKAGVMIRETLDADSAYALMTFSAGSNLSFQHRPEKGGTSKGTPEVPVPWPAWVKLVRSGDTFQASSSADGITWAMIGSATIPMAADVSIGLAVTAHDNGAMCASTLDHVTVTVGAAPSKGP